MASTAAETAALPAEFVTLRGQSAALQAEEFWPVDELSDEMLQLQLQAAADAVEGVQLRKYRKSGKVEPRRCHVRVQQSGDETLLFWQSGGGNKPWKSERVLRADAEVFETCFRGDANAITDSCVLQVILEKRMLFFSAAGAEQREVVVGGINALVTGRVVVLGCGPPRAA